jgi:hypothetical protein
VKTKAKRKVGRKVVKKPAARAKARPKVSARPKAKAKARAKAKATRKAAPARSRGATAARSRWVGFVAKHGIVLASAKGPVPNVAEAVAGEPIIGSWWAHPKGKAIFAALCEIDDSPDVRCFKLVDGKVTFAHRALWPALVRLAKDGVIAAEQLAAVQQEHMPSGEHRNIVTPFPDWVDESTAGAADKLTGEKARAKLAWIDAQA